MTNVSGSIHRETVGGSQTVAARPAQASTLLDVPAAVTDLSCSPAFQQQHYPVSYWARRWGFSAKTVREWFRDEYGPGILRQAHTGRRRKRNYTTITVSPAAAERVYRKHTEPDRAN
jgi:hypothetical protein